MGTTTTNYSVIYAFGDSLSDAGNAYLLTDSTEAALLGLSPEPVHQPYYQEVYTGGVTADVFSNGPVWTQDLSQALALGTLAPSGLGATASTLLTALTPDVGAGEAALIVDGLEVADGDIPGVGNPYLPLVSGATGGTDYAIGGAVTGATTENIANGNAPQAELTDLSAQLATFDAQVPAPAANALATLSIGSNDVLSVLEDPAFTTDYGTGTTLANVGTTVAGQDVAQAASIESAFIGSLVAQGLTSVLVLNVPNLGETPELTELYPTETAAATVLSEYYDTLLSNEVATINAADSSAHVTIENAFTLIDAAIANPGSYGLQNVTSPVYSGTYTAYVPADLVSTNVGTQDTYLFFDHLHPTETGESDIEQAALAALGLTCFAEGTRIRTLRGDVAVQDLRIGERVVLADGATAPVVWTGHRTVTASRLAKPQAAWPVRVRAGAFGPSMPTHDVFLSPDHAVLVDGALIPAKYLIDGDAITQLPCETVTYWHVELPRHALLLAEGLPCESFLDTAMYSDTGAVRPRHADYVSRVWEAEACAELVVAGPRLDAARRTLARRAAS